MNVPLALTTNEPVAFTVTLAMASIETPVAMLITSESFAMVGIDLSFRNIVGGRAKIVHNQEVIDEIHDAETRKDQHHLVRIDLRRADHGFRFVLDIVIAQVARAVRSGAAEQFDIEIELDGRRTQNVDRYQIGPLCADLRIADHQTHHIQGGFVHIFVLSPILHFHVVVDEDVGIGRHGRVLIDHKIVEFDIPAIVIVVGLDVHIACHHHGARIGVEIGAALEGDVAIEKDGARTGVELPAAFKRRCSEDLECAFVQIQNRAAIEREIRADRW